MIATISTRRWLRSIGVAGAVGALGLTGLAGASSAAVAPARPASWFAATVGASGVNVRDCYHPTVQLPPSTSCTFHAALSAGTAVHIVCQRSGQNIGGDAVWDYITYPGGEGLAADYYINTGYSSWIPGVAVCS